MTIVLFTIIVTKVTELLPILSFMLPNHLKLTVTLALTNVTVDLTKVLTFQQRRAAIGPLGPKTTATVIAAKMCHFAHGPVCINFILVLTN